MRSDFKDLTGKRFGRLIVLGLDEERNEIERRRKERGEIKHFNIFYKCRCDCGNIISVQASGLKNGTKSCGCLHKEISSAIMKKTMKKQNRYEEFDNYYKGWDTKNENYFLISKEDYKIVSRYCWSKATQKKRPEVPPYWTAYDSKSKKRIKMHQLICMNINNEYSPETKLVPDHLNGNPSDNRRDNLKIKTRAENCRNKTKSSNNTSGRTGVSYSKRDDVWIAHIKINYKDIRKQFKTKEEAVKQREEWEEKYNFTYR